MSARLSSVTLSSSHGMRPSLWSVDNHLSLHSARPAETGLFVPQAHIREPNRTISSKAHLSDGAGRSNEHAVMDIEWDLPR